MRIRYLLIVLAGVCLLPGAALAERAPEARENTASKEEVTQTWNVRWTQRVLDQHFESKHFALEATDNFVIIHDTDSHRANLRSRLLERTHQRFYEVFETFTTLDSPPKPLVCVLFADRDDFAHYAQRVDWLDMSWSGGYYSSRTNRMALYDAQPREYAHDAQTEAVNDGANTQNEQNDETADIEPEAVSNNAGSNSTSASPPLNLASTTHEAAHQLAFNSGLQRRGVMYPFWLSEGLACAFETNRADDSLGLGQLNTTRLNDLRHAMNNDGGETGLVPLREFITLVRPRTNNAQHLNAVYAQAWALFRFLYLHDRENLATYLRRLAEMPHGSRAPAAIRREFTNVFGPVSAMEQRWQAHLETLR